VLSDRLTVGPHVGAGRRSVHRERTAPQGPIGPTLERLGDEPIRRSESMDVAPDELSLACRLSGLTVDELWLRYLEIGGSRSRSELQSRLRGAAWPGPDDCYLSVVADEALLERGLPRLAQPAVPLAAVVDDGSPDDAAQPGLRRTAAAVAEARAQGTRMTELVERCARARAHARGVRQHAASVRRTRHARTPPSPGES
jgi:hypothetical protein